MTAPTCEVSYIDTLGIAVERRSRRLEFNLRANAERLYVEREPKPRKGERQPRVRPPIVVSGRVYPRRIRIQRPGEATLARVRGLVERGRAVVTRVDCRV
jgi:hypothetical protein